MLTVMDLLLSFYALPTCFLFASCTCAKESLVHFAWKAENGQKDYDDKAISVLRNEQTCFVATF